MSGKRTISGNYCARTVKVQVERLECPDKNGLMHSTTPSTSVPPSKRGMNKCTRQMSHRSTYGPPDGYQPATRFAPLLEHRQAVTPCTYCIPRDRFLATWRFLHFTDNEAAARTGTHQSNGASPSVPIDCLWTQSCCNNYRPD